MFKNWLWEEKHLWYVGFVDFRSVNIPIMANIKLPQWQNQVWRCEPLALIGQLDPDNTAT